MSEEFSIENQTTSRNIVITINIEKFNEADCPFTIKWSRGAEIKGTFDSIDCILCLGNSVFFVLKFKPKKRDSFSVEAPIYVRGELDGVFNKLHLEGEFLQFDRRRADEDIFHACSSRYGDRRKVQNPSRTL